MVNKKNIAIIGAGPGGLVASLLLAHAGHRVTLLESRDRVGGRSSRIDLGPYHFEAGPTFFIYRAALDEVFAKIGKKLDDYVDLTPLDPLYDLIFPSGTFTPRLNAEDMIREIERFFPGEGQGYRRYLKEENVRFTKIAPLLKRPFSSLLDYLHWPVISALPELDIGRSLYQRLQRYFRDERLLYSMAFQAKYLGMSPWKAPSLFSILSFMEHRYGVWHIQGGLYHLNEALAKLARSMGVTVQLNARVKKMTVERKRVTGLMLEDGSVHSFDDYVMNADFAEGIRLLDEKDRPSYRDAKLNQLEYSCSTFMVYLGLDTVYPLKHHTIVFSKDYPAYVRSLTEGMNLTDDFSFYVHNPSPLDPSYAPHGHSSLYVLVPVPNLRAAIDWRKEEGPMVQRIFEALERKLHVTDLRKHIRAQKVISPLHWEKDYAVHFGATFNLSHRLSQMLYYRPHNRYNDLNNLYLVGGGTHPGSGLPTIYQSAMITAELIEKNSR